jgi:hypothetical protein
MLRILPKLNVSHQTTEWVFANLRFLLFLGFLGLIYIANAHLAEANVRRIQLLQREIKELKWEYISIKSETMYKSMQSQLEQSVEPSGLDLRPDGPKVIKVE